MVQHERQIPSICSLIQSLRCRTSLTAQLLFILQPLRAHHIKTITSTQWKLLKSRYDIKVTPSAQLFTGSASAILTLSIYIVRTYETWAGLDRCSPYFSLERLGLVFVRPAVACTGTGHVIFMYRKLKRAQVWSSLYAIVRSPRISQTMNFRTQKPQLWFK